MITAGGEARRSNPLSDPPAFSELAHRLAAVVDQPYDLVSVRDLFGDQVLAYQLSLVSGKPATVSLDREGIIMLKDDKPLPEGGRALIVADVHFTTHSIQAAASGLRQAGLEVVGLALLLQLAEEPYTFPVWALENATRNSA
jgi:hypothetical protein